MTKSRIILTTLLTAGIVLPLAACAPGSGTPAASSSSGPVVTDYSKIKATTITELDTFSDAKSALSIYMEKVNAAFMKKYPKITVKRQTVAGDLTSTLKLKISDPSGPDIVPANQGWAGVGALSAAGLLLNLDPYAKAYGWDKRFPHSLIQQHMATTDGKSFGSGSVFGVPVNQGAFVTVFYNRALMSQLGLQVPKSYQDFEDSMATAKAKGVVPMEMGLQDQAATASLLALNDALGDAGSIRDLVYGLNDTTVEQTGMTKAAKAFQGWADKGYFPSGYQGTTIADAATNFVKGTGLYFIYYTGYLPGSLDDVNKFGTFIMPNTAGTAAPVTGSSAQNFSVASNSKSKDASALYLDFISAEENGQISIDVDNSPIIGQWPADTDSPMLNDTLAVLNQADKTDGYLPYFDWSTPTMLTTMASNQSLLAADKMTPADYTKALQADYEKFRDSKK